MGQAINYAPYKFKKSLQNLYKIDYKGGGWGRGGVEGSADDYVISRQSTMHNLRTPGIPEKSFRQKYFHSEIVFIPRQGHSKEK